jgi:CMP-N,N'-diacetyllegionaminic acid synthase
VKPLDRPVVGRQGAPVVHSLSPSVYAIRRDALWAFDHWSQAKLAVHPIPRERAVDIDTELDFTIVECMLAAGRPQSADIRTSPPQPQA